MQRFLRIAAFLLIIGGSFEALGLLSHELDRIISLLGLGLFFATFGTGLVPAGRPEGRRALASAACLVAAVPAARLAPLGIAWFHLLVVAGVALWCARSSRPVQLELRAYVWAFCIVIFLADLARLFPLLWHVERTIASVWSNLSELVPRPATFGTVLAPWRWTREPRNLGPTAMGLPLLVALAAIFLGHAATSAGRWRPRDWVALPVLAAAHLAYLLLLTPYAGWLARNRPSWSGPLMNSQWLFLVIGTATLALVTARSGGSAESDAGSMEGPGTAGGERPSRRDLSGGRWRLAGGVGFGVLIVLVQGRIEPPTTGSVDVMLYDAGYTNWDVPQHGRYGENSAGMFGVLPSLLQAAGHRVERGSDLRRLVGADPPGCLVMINIQKFLDPEDRDRILQFVRNGGGLLCLGDHTGVAGIRGPFNDLLAHAGIRLAFDSATFFAGGWTNALALRSHPLNTGVVNDEDSQIWVGASLDLEPRAAPVIVGRYGWSDLGDMTNLQMAYLGDRRYNPEELLGDVVLVAESPLGRGKILVFGDTSTFQNLALPRSWELVLRSIDHLGHPGSAPPSLRRQIVELLLFATILGLLTRGGALLAPLASVCAGLLVASAAWAAAVRPAPAPMLAWSGVAPPTLAAAVTPLSGTAIIDRSHGGRFDLRAWQDASIGGLTLNLMRDGWFPIVTEKFPRRQLQNAAVVILVAPQRAYSGSERQLLRAFLERGGRLIICCGYEELDGARQLLRDYGLGVRDLPLAHFRTGPNTQDLVFLEAWSVEFPESAAVLVRQWGQPVVASMPVGRGTLVLIGDTHYLLNRNLEGRAQWFPGNLAFLSALDRGIPIQPVEGTFGEPHEQGALADSPAPVPASPAVRESTAAEASHP